MSVIMDLRKQTEAAKTLMIHLQGLGVNGDEEAVQDAMEGETSLFEAISEAARSEWADAQAIKGLKDFEKEIGDRIARLKSRAEATRAAIAAAMGAAGLKSERTPFGTVTIKVAAPKAVITEEADIPLKFVVTPLPVQPDPYVDVKALAAALKEGEKVPGAHLSNGGFTSIWCEFVASQGNQYVVIYLLKQISQNEPNLAER